MKTIAAAIIGLIGLIIIAFLTQDFINWFCREDKNNKTDKKDEKS